MAHGFPDWQPVTAGVGREHNSVNLVAAGDVVSAPGAALRRLLFWLHIDNEGVAGSIRVSEVTPANVFVKQLWRGSIAQNTGRSLAFDGLPLTLGNKIRADPLPAGPVIFTAIFGTSS